jgi:hypothetical protein
MDTSRKPKAHKIKVRIVPTESSPCRGHQVQSRVRYPLFCHGCPCPCPCPCCVGGFGETNKTSFDIGLSHLTQLKTQHQYGTIVKANTRLKLEKCLHLVGSTHEEAASRKSHHCWNQHSNCPCDYRTRWESVSER